MATRMTIPSHLNEAAARSFPGDLDGVACTEDVVLDCSKIQHVEPFALLMISSGIRRLAARLHANNQDLRVAGARADSFESRMGFFQSIGVKIGHALGSDTYANTFVPITRIDIAQLIRQAVGGCPIAAGLVDAEAARLAGILTQGQDLTLGGVLAYAFRELFRNIIEHSRSGDIWFCASYRPTKDDVQVAVVDDGEGIRQALSREGKYAPKSDEESLELAIQRGVTGVSKPRSVRIDRERWTEYGYTQPPEFFDNSGWGLFVLSELGRESGQFMICSGEASLAFLGSTGAKIHSSASHQGTGVRLVLHPTRLEGVLDRLLGLSPGNRITLSMMKRLGIQNEPPTGSSARDFEP